MQANIRGYITRKKIRAMQFMPGMADYQYNDDLQQDYDNPKV